ncbi:MAG: DUF4124 domain-containing protein [Halieaceae bacterium]|nr:DUF4124 domain-containing protein [Halieaceae bacterium]
MRAPAKTISALLAALVLGAAMAPVALAEKGYYKWVDARGNPVHSDRPPAAGIEYEFVSTETGLRRRVTAEENTDNPPGWASSAPVGSEEPNAAEQQAAIEKDPAVCDQARANLDTLNSKARVRIRDDDGIRYLTEEEKSTQRKKAQDLIDVHCGS